MSVFRKSGQTRLIVVAVCVAIGAAAAFTQYVHRGYVGAIEAGGSVRLLDSGLHLRAPWNRVTFYPVRCWDTTIKSSTEGPQGRVNFDLLLRLSVSRDQVPSLHTSYKGRYVEMLVAPLVADFLKRRGDASLDSYGSGAVAVGKDLVAYLNSALAPYGVTVFGADIRSYEVVTNPEDQRIAAEARALGGQVILLGIDAFDWQVYREVSRSRRLPNIERLISEGTTGDLLSMEPIVSPMIWTTMATGVEPPVHGIVDFLMKDAATGEDVPITSSMRRVPALWNMVTRYGGSAGFIGWLGTFPAEPVRGFMVSDRVGYHIFDPRWQKGASYEADAERANLAVEGLTYPDSLLEEIRPLVRSAEDIRYQTVSKYIEVPPEDLASDAKTFDPLDLPRNLRVALASNATYEAVAQFTYEKFGPDVFSVYLDLIDNACHLFIKHMAPHTPDVSDRDAARYGQAVAQAYAHVDSVIGWWLDAIDSETTLMVISDHGFKSGDLRPAAPSVIGAPAATAWHRMAGAIALWGKNVRRGATLSGARVIDVCPTVLALAGLPGAEDMPGVVLEDAFDPEWVTSRAAIEPIETYGARTDIAASPRNREEEAAILERLKALGYVGSGPTDLSKLAHSHFIKGEFDKAIEIWREMLSRDPSNLDVMVSLANALIQKGDLDRAYTVLRDASKRDPDHLPSQNMLALYHINVGHLDEAARISAQVIARDAKNAEAYFNLGVTYDLQARYDQALSAFKRSVELRGDFDQSRINLGNAYLRKGNTTEARAQFEKALEVNPASTHAWYSLGKVLHSTGQPDEAARAYREALKHTPAFSPARISLAVTLVSSGRMAEAKRELEQGLGYPYDLAAINTNMGIIDRQMGDDSSAERRFRQAIQEDPEYLPARLDLARLYFDRGDKAKARKELEAVLRLDPGNREAKAAVESLE
ncbi:MAG: tetratricopeptide repeat protein [bacterium]